MSGERKEIKINISWDNHTTKNHVGVTIDNELGGRIVGSHMIHELEDRFKNIIERLKAKRG